MLLNIQRFFNIYRKILPKEGTYGKFGKAG